MTPTEVRTTFENAVNAIAPVEVPVLGADQPLEAEVADAWIRVDVRHTDEPPEDIVSGRVRQGVDLRLTVYTPHGETSRGDVLAEQMRAGLANQVFNGIRIGSGRFSSVVEDDLDSLDNFAGLRVSLSAVYDQE